MPKATLMVRFKRPEDATWLRRPAVFGSTGRVKAGSAVFKDEATGRPAKSTSVRNSASRCASKTAQPATSQPAAPGRRAGQARKVLGRLEAKKAIANYGLVAVDPEKEKKKRVKLADLSAAIYARFVCAETNEFESIRRNSAKGSAACAGKERDRDMDPPQKVAKRELVISGSHREDS